MALSYELTRDPAQLEQYYSIREECFRRELGLGSFDGSEDVHDRRSHILIARDGDRCVGGVRLTGRAPQTSVLLPLEEAGFDLDRALPELRLNQASCCQWSRFALAHEYRSIETLLQYCSAMIETSRRLGHSYSLVVAGMNRSRLYKRLYSALGYRYEIVRGVRIPAEPHFDRLPHLLAVGYLDGTRHRAALRAVA